MGDLADILFYAMMAAGLAFIVYIGKIIHDDRALIFAKKDRSYIQFFFVHRKRQAVVVTTLFACYFALFIAVLSIVGIRPPTG